jgi:hypothetical protein
LAPALTTPAQKAARPEDPALLGLFGGLLWPALRKELVGGVVLPGSHALFAVYFLVDTGPVWCCGGSLRWPAFDARRFNLRLLDLGFWGRLAMRLAARCRRDLYLPAATLRNTLRAFGQRTRRSGLAALSEPALVKAALVAPTLASLFFEFALFEPMSFGRTFCALVL